MNTWESAKSRYPAAKGEKAMRVTETCVNCLWKRQQRLSDDPSYLSEIRQILDSRKDSECSPYLVYLFNQAHERHFGKRPSYQDVKKAYNDLMLSMESDIREQLMTDAHPLERSFLYARTGNYIDFGVLSQVDQTTFLSLLQETSFSQRDRKVWELFLRRCQSGKNFLLIADNCGEIVLDKLFLEQLHLAFPWLRLTVMVRGEEVLNDVTAADAAYVQIDRIASVISNGTGIGGTICSMISDEAKEAINKADVILAKGQGNYESLSGQGRRIFYSFLCKCERFVRHFQVPALTGMLVADE